jgi:hypothetical protein
MHSSNRGEEEKGGEKGKGHIQTHPLLSERK